LTRPLGTLTRPFCSIYGRPRQAQGRPLPVNSLASSRKFFFSKPIRRLEPIERPAEEARQSCCFFIYLEFLDFLQWCSRGLNFRRGGGGNLYGILNARPPRFLSLWGFRGIFLISTRFIRTLFHVF
jgi:hypothetical protein